MSNQTSIQTIEPHGGTLINREVSEQQRQHWLETAESLPKVTLNPWSLSELELIGIGGFSPLTVVMGEKDYLNVIENVHLDNGLVWSIPITLPVTQTEADALDIGQN
ncbi:sulfate adenylyltransferase, partial [Staphylococcus equorum]